MLFFYSKTQKNQAVMSVGGSKPRTTRCSLNVISIAPFFLLDVDFIVDADCFVLFLLR